MCHVTPRHVPHTQTYSKLTQAFSYPLPLPNYYRHAEQAAAIAELLWKILPDSCPEYKSLKMTSPPPMESYSEFGGYCLGVSSGTPPGLALPLTIFLTNMRYLASEPF